MSTRIAASEVLVGTPTQEDPKVGPGMRPGLAAVANKVRRHRGAQNELIGTCDTGAGSRGRNDSHTTPCVTGQDEYRRSLPPTVWPVGRPPRTVDVVGAPAER